MPDHSRSQEQTESLQQALKQFSLETDRLEWVYQNLETRFKTIQENVRESHIRLAGKLAELGFVTRYLETILNHISQGIVFIDLNGIVTTYNAAAQSIFAIPEKSFLLHSFGNFFKDDFLGFSLKASLISKLCPKTNFITWTREDGKKFELEIEAAFVAMNAETAPIDYRQPPASTVHGLLILIRNLTEMRQLQMMVNRHDLLKELGEMAAHMAHEIRNPLGGIKGFATLLHQDLQDKPEMQKMAGYIIEGTDHLNSFVSGILQYTKPFQPQLESVEIVHFLNEIKLLMQADSSWNPLITFDVQSALPKLFIEVDPQLFRSALLNLLVNAAQAMPNGGELTVSIDCIESEVQLNIKDTGVGISAENLTKIFSPFFTTKPVGTGLGLAEVHKVIQAHRGWINVQSEVGKGSCFTIKMKKSE